MTYDTVIIGAGPAGLAAGLYAGRGTLKTLIIEQGGVGGQIATSWDIENYPGAAAKMTGPELTERMREQCVEFGVEFKVGVMADFEKKDDWIFVTTDKEQIKTQTLILATGATPRKIGCKGEEELRGQGVSYCATCDASFFKHLNVAVVGGGDTALEDALLLAKYAKSVTIIHRRQGLRAAKILQNRVEENEKISFLLDSVVEEIKGSNFVEAMVVRNVNTNELSEMPIDGIFVLVGLNPNTKGFEKHLKLNEKGYIVTGDDMKTEIPGIFAAGDLRQKPLRQVVTATSDGAVAAVGASKFIEEGLALKK